MQAISNKNRDLKKMKRRRGRRVARIPSLVEQTRNSNLKREGPVGYGVFLKQHYSLAEARIRPAMV